MIHLRKVNKFYKEKAVVKDVSFEVSEGELCVLIGPSGCGKTTTLRMINRMLDPTSGEIFIKDKNIKKIRPEILRRSIGYVIQMVGLFPHMNVSDNISVVPQLLKWDKKRIQKRTEELLMLIGLEPGEYWHKYPHQLSGGEAQRIGVARALAANPPILLMDEPFGAVDPLNRAKLQTQFLNIQKKLHKTIILVTHDLDEAIKLADKIVLMNNGEIIQFDTPETILSKPVNKFVYNFVGSDRALKRLSRIKIDKYIKPVNFINIDDSKESALSKCKQCRWIWVTNNDKKLTGWIDTEILVQSESVREALADIKPEDISISEGSSLRDALSVMLSQGVKIIPVVNEDEFLLGQIEMSEIEEALIDK